mgnify:FL=1
MRYLIVVVLSALFLVSNASAWGSGVTDPFSVYTDKEKGSDFEAKFEIEADGDGKYAIKLESRSEFTFSSYRIEKDILDGDSRTFIFNGETAQTLEDGEYRISWTAYKDNQEIDSGDFDISAGEQAPGFELGIALISIGLIAIIRKRSL